jgi:hypothetical protein
MFALSVMAPKVVGGLQDLPPEGEAVVQHLHVRLHLIKRGEYTLYWQWFFADKSHTVGYVQ